MNTTIIYIIEKSIKYGLSTKPQFYKEMSARAGRNYHTAEIRTIEEAIAMKAIARSVASYFKKTTESGAKERTKKPSTKKPTTHCYLLIGV